MDPNSGRLHNVNDFADALSRGLVPVRRDLTVKEQAEMQIRLYSPCACGSGKKFKFCCFRKRATDSAPAAPWTSGLLGYPCPACGITLTADHDCTAETADVAQGGE